MRIASVGECTVDRYVDRYVGRDEVRVGGISLNFAVHARRAGAAQVNLVSCTGDDLAGEMVRAALAREGIDATHLATRRGRTASQAIELAHDGERNFPPGGYDEGVLADFRLDDAALAMLRTVDLIAFPWFRQLEPLVAPLLEEHTPASLRVADLLDGADLGPAFQRLDALLGALDVAFLSASEAVADTLRARTRGARALLVVTHGARGSTGLHDGRATFTAAEPVPPTACIDSTGCGDAYQGAFAVHYARDRDIAAAMRAGSARAARVIRHLGAFADER